MSNAKSNARLERRLRRVSVSAIAMQMMMRPGRDLFECVAGIPDGAEYVGVWCEGFDDRVSFLFAHPSWEPVPEGSISVPEIDVRYMRHVGATLTYEASAVGENERARV